jgi:hypothetical protein
MPEMKSVLECVECKGRLPLSAIANDRYIIGTMTCRICYDKMQEDQSKCFGKSYDPKATECRLHCSDREVCGDYLKGKQKMTDVDLEDVDFDGIEDEDDSVTEVEEEETPAPKAKTPGKGLKASTPTPKAKKEATKVTKTAPKVVAKAVPAKAVPTKAATKAAPKATVKAAPAKAKKEATAGNLEGAPKDWAFPRLPHKAGSMMQRLWLMLYKGCTFEAAKKFVESENRDWPLMLRVMRRAIYPMTPFDWELDEEGGRLKITNVKFLGNYKPNASVVKEAKTAKAAATKKVVKTKVGKSKGKVADEDIE